MYAANSMQFVTLLAAEASSASLSTASISLIHTTALL